MEVEVKAWLNVGEKAREISLAMDAFEDMQSVGASRSTIQNVRGRLSEMSDLLDRMESGLNVVERAMVNAPIVLVNGFCPPLDDDWNADELKEKARSGS